MPAESSDSLCGRLSSLWRLKLALLVVLTAGFCVPYMYLAHNAFFPVRTLPLLWIDRVAGFDARWVWVYQSIYLLTSTLPLLADSKRDLRRFVNGFVLLAGASFVFYLFLPVRLPRPEVTEANWFYSVLLFYDGPYSAFPSLHAGFLYYTIAFAVRILPAMPRAVLCGLIVWGLLILWATLATKEHYFLDLPAGIALAIVADVVAWRSKRGTIDSNADDGSR